jgi:tetratricopeptide (TPR) repeat protein
MKNKNFDKATLYYISSLKMIEGVGGLSAQYIRIKCLFDVAMCLYSNGDTYEAITKLTDIIDECPESLRFNGTIKQKKLLSSTYLYRGYCFQSIGLPSLAFVDFKESLSINPRNKKVIQIIKQLTKKEFNTTDNVLISNRYNFSTTQDDLNSIVDYANNVSYIPTISLSIYDIDKLLDNKKSKNIIKQKENSFTYIEQILLNEDKFKVYLPIIQQVSGIDSSTIKQMYDIIQSLYKVAKLFNKVFSFIFKFSGFIFGFIWILFAFNV